MAEEKSRLMTIFTWVLILVSSWKIFSIAFYLFDEAPIFVQGDIKTPLLLFVTAQAKIIDSVLLILSIATLVGALGLLWRKHWARTVLMGALSIGVIHNVIEILINLEFLRGISEISVQNTNSVSSNAEDFHNKVGFTVRLGFWALIIFDIGMSLIYIWIVKRLMYRRSQNK